LDRQSDNDSFPPGLNNAYLFAVFNALSFQIVLSSPMVLYAKFLGATATVLGIIAGMMPLLVIFQIPAAQYVSRVGYKRFVYAGWGTRVMFIFAMALVPITYGFLNPTSRLALMLMLLFGFNLSRGISSAGWLPWITSLVPPSVRGRYLARDAGWQNLASFCVFLLAAFCLGRNPSPWRFALLFLFSAAMGATSLTFLKRIPESATPEVVRSSSTPVPWREMVHYAPFRKLLRMVIAWSAAYGGMTVFTVAFLRVKVGMPEGTILMVNSISFLGGLSSLWFLGSRLDHLGSKPVLVFTFAAWLLVVAGWGLLAGKVLPPWLSFIVMLQFFMGLCAALVQMSNTRLAMAIVPVMGRSHFFAIYSVLANVSLGLAPILWGLVIDAVGSQEFLWFGLEWNRYSIFFMAVALVLVITAALARRLEEPEAASLEELLKEILIQSPQRVLVRFWPKG
jgi:MFS family permease